MSIELFQKAAEQAPAIPPRHWWVWEDVSFLNCHRIHPMQQRKVVTTHDLHHR